MSTDANQDKQLLPRLSMDDLYEEGWRDVGDEWDELRYPYMDSCGVDCWGPSDGDPRVYKISPDQTELIEIKRSLEEIEDYRAKIEECLARDNSALHYRSDHTPCAHNDHWVGEDFTFEDVWGTHEYPSHQTEQAYNHRWDFDGDGFYVLVKLHREGSFKETGRNVSWRWWSEWSTVVAVRDDLHQDMGDEALVRQLLRALPITTSYEYDTPTTD